MSFPETRIIQIAQVVYEAQRTWLRVNGNTSYPVWEKLNTEDQSEVISGVRFHIDNPLAGDAGFHNRWLRERETGGWKWGRLKDDERLTDPRVVPFHLLPPEDQARDRLFNSIVKALVRV